MDDFAQFYQAGGFFMHPIALCVVLGAGVMIERFIFLFFRFNINGGQFFNQVQKLVMANNIDRAIKLCNAADKAALARVMKAGLTRPTRARPTSPPPSKSRCSRSPRRSPSASR